MRRILVAAALAFRLLAQSKVSPEIRGTVTEPGTNAPVPEAEITLEYYGTTQPRIMPSPSKSTVTACQGTMSSRFCRKLPPETAS